MIASVTSANPALLVLTAKIVAAHAGGNEVPAGAVPDVIRDVYHTLSEIAQNGGGATITQSMPAAIWLGTAPASGRAPKAGDASAS
jgi:predicted transcriptional regulator